MGREDGMSFDDEGRMGLVLVYGLLSKTKVRVAAGSQRGMARSFCKLLQAISHGSTHSREGDYVVFVPGTLRGGEAVVKCEDEVSAYIEPLLVLCAFVTEPLRIRFKGVTNGERCVDMIRIAHLGVLRRFGVDGCEVVVKKRGFGPLGGGEVVLSASGPKRVGTIALEEEEKIVKVRGLVLSSRMSSIATREMTERIKELMGDVLSTKVFSSMSNRLDSGPSPGFQCAVFAESRSGIFYHVSGSNGLTPKETAAAACRGLLQSIRKGGVFDEKLVYLALSLMAVSSTSVGSLRIGRAGGEAMAVLGLLERFFGFGYEVRGCEDGHVVYGAGCGLTSISRVLR